MSDYSFMRTGGMTPDKEQEEVQKTQKNLMSMVMIFAEDAIKMWGIYTEHAGRQVAVETDLQKALKVRALHGNEFWNLPDVQQRINEHREWLDQDPENEMDIDTHNVENNTEEYSYSYCNCTICTHINQIDEQWVNWNPTEGADITLKNAIENTYF